MQAWARIAPRGPGVDSPARCAAESRCTTERWSTHNTDVLEVRYPWHPWYGRQVRVRAVRTRNGPPVVRCTILGEPLFPVQEIPRWMFEPAADGTREVADVARVDLAALRALAALLVGSASSQDLDMVEAQHPPFTRGDADANAIAVPGPPVGAVPAVPYHPGDPARRLPQDGTVAGPPAARACPPDRPSPRRTGGGT